VLLTAEAVSSAASVIAAAPSVTMSQEWQMFLFHQFHDILCGCAISITYREAHQRLTRVLGIAGRHTQEALEELAAVADTGKGEGPSIIVFNPLAWMRDDIVRIPLDKLGDKLPSAVRTAGGKVMPVQISGHDLLFIAEDIPGLGFQTFQPILNLDPILEGEVQPGKDNFTLSNGIIRMTVDAETGEITNLFDIIRGRNYSGEDSFTGDRLENPGFLNRFMICWEKPHGMSAWNIGEISQIDPLPAKAKVRLVEIGPVQGVIEVQHQFLNSSLTQRIVLNRKLPRIDFETVIDWHEHGNLHDGSPMLRVYFAPQLGASKATFEIPFAGLVRPANGHEVPAQRWIDVSAEDGTFGLSLLNDGKYGHQVEGNTLSLTLVRASYEPDINPDEGLQEFTYSLYPHEGDWRQALSLRRAVELNQPVVAAVTNAHPGDVIPGNPCLECSSQSVMVSAFKSAEEQTEKGRATIVRLYETDGQAAATTQHFNFPVLSVEETDLMENTIGILPSTNNEISLVFSPHEIKTIKLLS